MTRRILDRIAQGPASQAALRDGVRTISYADLWHLLRTEARWQREQASSRVAILADNGSGWVISDLALLARGALNVPLPGYFTAAQLTHALDDASIDAVLTDDPQRVLALGMQWRFHSRSPATDLALLTRSVPSEHRAAHDAAKVTYTSGSTSAPKGVCLSAASLDEVARSIAMATRPLSVDRHLCLLPLPTLLENVAGVYAPLCLGATCEIPSLAATGMSYGQMDTDLLLASISRARPGSLILVPELLRVLVAAADRGWTPPSTLKFIAVGGAVVAPELLEHAAAMKLPVYEGYGLSECASVVCLNTPGSARRGSVGRPLPHARVRVDAAGEIRVSGALMNGYVGESEGMREAEFATGDLGEIDAEGFVYVRGRLKNLFISSMGRNVCPEWIERELTRNARIGHAVVFGEGRLHPVAVLSPIRPQVADSDLQQAVADANRNLPEYAQIHRWIRADIPFTFQSGLATANGRPRRDAIAARHRHRLDLESPAAIAS
jgi:long-subunit acyl-CoA synthetase (AMP-forming)